MAEQPTRSPPHGNIKQALLDAREEAIISSRAGDAPARKKSSRALPILLLLTIAFGAYALGTKPAWFVTPPPEPESPAITQASLRVAMWQQALYVERFETEQGRLPRTLAEAGAPAIEGITYEITGDEGYLIQGQIPGTGLLLLGQQDSKQAFLGNSMSILANRGAQ